MHQGPERADQQLLAYDVKPQPVGDDLSANQRVAATSNQRDDLCLFAERSGADGGNGAKTASGGDTGADDGGIETARCAFSLCRLNVRVSSCAAANRSRPVAAVGGQAVHRAASRHLLQQVYPTCRCFEPAVESGSGGQRSPGAGALALGGAAARAAKDRSDQ